MKMDFIGDVAIDTYHGVEVADPFRWLENHRAARTRQWINVQAKRSRSYLDALPERSRLLPRIAATLEQETTGDICTFEDTIFYVRRRAKEEQAKLFMRMGFQGSDELIFDPTLSGEGTALSLSILGVSMDGRSIALGLRTGGEGMRRLRILDLRDRSIRAELPKGALRGFGFLPNGSGFIYSIDPIGNGGHSRTERQRTTKIHYFGQSSDSDIVIFGTEAAQNIRLISDLHQRPPTAIHTVIRTHPSGNLTSIYLQDLDNTSFPIRRLKAEDSERWQVRIHDGDLFIFISRPDSLSGSLVRVPLNTLDLSQATTVLSTSGGRIERWHIFGNQLVTTTVENISSVLTVFSLEGSFMGKIELPHEGTARVVTGDDRGIFYTFESYKYPQQVYYYSFALKASRLFSGTPSVDFESAHHHITVRREDYLAEDRTSIPLTLLAKREVFDRGDAPVLLTAYGASGVSLTPQHSCLATNFVELGGVFAIAHVRGGGEKGIAWGEAGKRHNRPTVHRDFIAAAEFIVTSGIGNRTRVAIAGGSNSGLLVTTAMTERPDLFCAVVCLAPFTDMLRYHLFDNTQFYVPQFGCAENPEDFSVLLSYSPYHNVRDRIAYPALLMISGDADTRCDPMHARKFVARVQQAMSIFPTETLQQNPILLDWDPLRGHSATLPLTTRIRALTDRMAFLCHHLGMEV
jgi:prolyl oligopeptidase